MNSETEQRLATLEVILEQELLFRPPYHDGDFLKPYIWDSEQQGIFSPLLLIKAEEIERKYNLLSSFLHGNFPELLVYRFCFWDYEHLYILGETGDRDDALRPLRDRVGVSLHSQFTYNP